MGNTLKAKYYHDRMINHELEPDTIEKLSSVKWVVDKREELCKRHVLQFKSFFEMFQEYNANPNTHYVFPHEDLKYINKYFEV